MSIHDHERWVDAEEESKKMGLDGTELEMDDDSPDEKVEAINLTDAGE